MTNTAHERLMGIASTDAAYRAAFDENLPPSWVQTIPRDTLGAALPTNHIVIEILEALRRGGQNA